MPTPEPFLLMVPEVRCCVHGGLEREPLAPVKV
jgi:hypothetical protein